LAEGALEVGRGAQPGQLTPTDQRDIPYHMMSLSVQGKKQEVGDIRSYGISLHK